MTRFARSLASRGNRRFAWWGVIAAMALVVGVGVGPQPGYAAQRSTSSSASDTTAAASHKTHKAAKAAKALRSEQAVPTKQTSNTEQDSRTKKTSKAERVGKTDQVTKAEQADKTQQVTKPERAGKTEQAGKTKQAGKAKIKKPGKIKAGARAPGDCDVARIPCCLGRTPCCLARDICDPGPVVTAVEQLNYAADLKVTWTYSTQDSTGFTQFKAKADTGEQCTVTGVGSTTCTIADVPVGSRQITVEAVYGVDAAPGNAYPFTVPAIPAGARPALSVSFSEAQISDHRSTSVVIDLDRTVTTYAAEDVEFQLALPTGLVVADSQYWLTCDGSVSLSEGDTSIQLTAGEINSNQANCRLMVAVTSTASGVYEIDSGDVSGLAGGVTNAVTTQTLTVVAAEPVLHGYFSPDHVDVKAVSTLRLDLSRTDTNPTAVASGLSYAISLPAALVVAPGRVVANTCGGTPTAVAGASTLALSAAALGAGVSSCRLSVAVLATTSGTHSFDNVTSSSGVDVYLACLDSVPDDDANAQTGYCEPTLVAAKIGQTLSFTQPADVSTSAGTVTLSGSATSGLAVTYNSGTVQVCTVDGTTVTLLAAGTCTITASQAGNGAYLAATPVPRTFAVTGIAPLAQTISFGPAGSVALSAATVPLSASASSGLTVTFSSGSPLICTAAGTTLTLLRTGDCVVEASQPGNSAYAAATAVTRTIAITKDAQAITFGALGAAQLGDGTVTATATASSGLTVALSSSTPQVCTVSGSTVSLVAAGICTIAADQPGNDRYDAAARVSRSFPVTAAPTAPGQVTATAGVSQIVVSWDAPADPSGITGYTATASPGPATCTTDGATTCVMGGTAGVTYTISVVATGAGGTSTPAGPSGEVTPTAPEPPVQVPDTDLDLTTDKGLITTAEPGQVVVFIGTGFAAHSTVTISIYSDPIVLGTVVTDENGDFSKPITIPPGLEEGAHTAVAQGVAPDGTERSMKLAIAVAAEAPAQGPGSTPDPAPGGGQLPVTGVNISTILLAGLLSLTTGTALMAATRRRRTA
jgi:hypothetical protein